jgi:dipeptidyl aminopeptidase/acylaminoacyl peptidase
LSAISEKAFTLENDRGLPIRCDLRTPEGSGPFPIVVMLHGFKGFKDWGMFPPSARHLAANGIACVSLNASMNGVGERLEEFTELEKFARNTPGREVLDVEHVLREIAGGIDPRLDPARLGLLGHSRGGGVVLLVAARNPHVKCVVTWASVASFFRYTKRAIEEWRTSGRLEVPNLRTGQILWLERDVLEDLEAKREEYDLEKACRKIEASCLVVHGKVDEAVGFEDAEKLSSWLASPEKRLLPVPSAGHTFGAVHPWQGPTPSWELVMRETTAWFRKHL